MGLVAGFKVRQVKTGLKYGLNFGFGTEDIGQMGDNSKFFCSFVS